MATRYIFVTGGVVSSLGKGITAASLGRLLKSRGLRVAMQKFDPYINLNPGMMSPLQHGEVFVTEDGGECDLDVGHYERFIDENLTVDSDVTSGQVYQSVINKERNGDYNGGTVQVIPHITDEIKKTLYRVARHSNADVVITEIGGTVGDIESQPFLEAARQVKWEVGSDHCMYIHVTLVPFLGAAGELKTKPTQHSVKELRSIGIQPDVIVTRCEKPLNRSVREKIGLFCNIDADHVIANYDAETLYDVPLMMQEEGLDEIVCQRLKLITPKADITQWAGMVDRLKNPDKQVRIALIGKYNDLKDAYLSLTEALCHAGIVFGAQVDILWVYSDEIGSKEDVHSQLKDADAVVIPGGFGERGMEGMILCAQYAREKGIPFFGIGLGTQMAVVEFARNVCGLKADSTELNPQTPHPVVALMAEHKDEGTMRLGNYTCEIKKGSMLHSIYVADVIEERHRNRYEINPEYAQTLEKYGLNVSGVNPETKLIESIELDRNLHPWFIGVLFHAEFTSRLNRPHPLFIRFVEHAIQKAENR